MTFFGRCQVNLRRTLVVLALICSIAGPGHAANPGDDEADLRASDAEAYGLPLSARIEGHRRLEEVLHARRLWPSSNPGRKPPIESILPRDALESRVLSYLNASFARERVRGVPFTEAELDQELVRMRSRTRDPETLNALFAALDHDVLLLRECLARPALVERALFDESENPPASASKDLVLLERTAGTNRVSGVSPPGTWTPTLGVEKRSWHTAVWTGSEMIVWGGNPPQTTGARYDPATDTWRMTSVADAPVSRRFHTAVWTGSEMIVWGGTVDGNSGLDSGGRYDPVTDSWIAISSGPNAPTGRWVHTAVWTGTEMVVWGGFDGTSQLGSGARYDPSGDAWFSTSNGTNCPSARFRHTAVWTGSEMIVWGGDSPTGALSSGAKYTPASDSWIPTSSGLGAPPKRSNHASVWTGTEMIVWGGADGSTDLNTGARYTPDSDSWVATSTGTGVPSARQPRVAAWAGSEMVVWGGYTGSGLYLNTGARYDPISNSWLAMASAAAPSARAGHSILWDGARIVVWGGQNSNNTFNTGGRYSPLTNSWASTSLAGVATPRRDHTAVWTGTEMIVWGGWITSPVTYLNTGARYTPSTDSWAPTSLGAAVPAGRQKHTAVWTGTEMIVWGGGQGARLNSGGRYNPASDSWVATSVGSNVPAVRDSHTAVWTGTEMIIWGGNSTGILYSSGGRYAPSTDSWVATSTGPGTPTGRVRHVAVWTGQEMIVWGGVGSGNVYFQSGGRYDPVADAWAPTSIGVGVPTAREDAASIWTGAEMVVWGGGNYLNSGGRYEPGTDTWQSMAVGADAPAGNAYPKAVWTGSEMMVFGSSCCASPSWGRYDPVQNSWVSLPVDVNVPERSGHTAVWTGSEMVIWGGSVGSETTGGGRYRPPECTGPPTLAGSVAANGSMACADLGVSLVWSSPLWNDDTNIGRRIQIFRDGVLLTQGGCSQLPSTATSCLDNTGENGVSYSYSVRFRNACGKSMTTLSAVAADSGPPSAGAWTSNSSYCPVESTTFAATSDPSFTYAWRNADFPGLLGTSETLDAFVTGTYIVAITNPDGCSTSPSALSTWISGCNLGCEINGFWEPCSSETNWTAEPDNDPGGFLSVVDFAHFSPVFDAGLEPRWYHVSYRQPTVREVSPGADFVFELGMSSLEASSNPLGSLEVSLTDDAGNVVAEMAWSDEECCQPGGAFRVTAEGIPIVAESQGQSQAPSSVIHLRRAGNLWTAYRNGVAFGSATVTTTRTISHVRLRFGRPPVGSEVSSMLVDYISLGAAPIVDELRLTKSPDSSQVTLTWSSPDASASTIQQDVDPSGSFGTTVANGVGPYPSAEVAMPAGDLLFFKPSATNSCGTTL